MSSNFAPLPAHVADAVEDSLETVEELRRLERQNTHQSRRGELAARIAIRAEKAGISTDELLQHCSLRIALEESHAAKARMVAA